MPRAPAKPKLSRYATWCEQTIARCVVLGIDPGASAGAALVAWTPSGIEAIWCRSIVTDTLDLEATVDDAIVFARSRGLPLIVVIEEWGKGGPLGIDQWLGLGAVAGAWKRAVVLACQRPGAAPTIVKTRATMRLGQRTWRSAIIPTAGSYVIDREGITRFKPHDTIGWKQAATARAAELFGLIEIPNSDAAEALLLAYCAMRDVRIALLFARRTRGQV